MLKQLIAAAAAQNEIVGLRVRPSSGGDFHVHIWVGPRIGERHEWFDAFADGTDPLAAIDTLAQRAGTYLNARTRASPGGLTRAITPSESDAAALIAS